MMTSINIGPGKLDTGSGNPFVLSGKEWISIQTYVEDGLHLPLNKDELRKFLQVDDSIPIEGLDDMLLAYQDVHGHCNTWKNETYPNSVNLANNIVHYANKARVYYDGLLRVVNMYLDNPSDRLKQKMEAIIATLASDAKKYSDNAANIELAINQFADETKSDYDTLKSLRAEYDKKFGTHSKEVIELQKELVAQKLILKSANEEYNHDVVVAATTPTYAWIIPFGTIAAAVVAGVYGHKAVEALDRAHKAQNKINEIGGKLARDANLMTLIQAAETGMDQILGDIAQALPAIQKVKGVWSAIHSDLDNLQKIIQDDIKNALDIIKDLGIEEAVKQWEKIGKEADGYRVYAYVDFTEKKAA